MENQEIFLAALAGLIHDIGKFALRAGESGSRIWDNDARAEFGHKHALLSDDFCVQVIPPAWRSKVRAAVGGHHRSHESPQQHRRLAESVAAADHLSAGERQTPAEDDAQIQPQQLRSIFNTISLDGKSAPAVVYWPLAALELKEEALIPKEKVNRQVADQYKTLWDAFFSQARLLGQAASGEEADLPLFIENLQLLLQRYTWCIPSAYYHSLPDVSLYDHARITSALSAILVESDIDQPVSSQPIALLIGADLSGVQSFLYTISSKGATSALRGRSFYLQLLNEAVARYTLSRLNLPVTNLLYASGGNFYIIARPSDRNRLKEIENEVSRVLYQAHRGDLGFTFGDLPLAAPDFYSGEISQKWSHLTEILQTKKLQRFAGLNEELAVIFSSEGHGGNIEQSCSVCGTEDSGAKDDSRPGEEPVYKCSACLSYEELGEDLRSARFMVLTFRDPSIPSSIAPGQPAHYSQVLQALGIISALYDKTPDPAPKERRLVLALKDESLSSLKPGSSQAVGRRYMVNVTPILTQADIENYQKNIPDLPKPGKIAPFEVLEAKSEGIPRLGVLRMDVDNLGQIFSKGLGQHATLSRVAALSFAVSLFFEGWVEVLGERLNREGKKDRLYSIYAGGDDLFFVGAWNAVLELSQIIRADLARFTGGHPEIHASAGVVLAGGKYPLAQAAADAGKAEDQAKRLSWWDQGGQVEHHKDAICFLGQAVPWRRFGLEEDPSNELNTVSSMAGYFIKNHQDLHPYLQRLIDFQGMYQKETQRRQEAGIDQTRTGVPQPLFGRWNWLSAYILQRAVDRDKSDTLKRLKQDLDAKEFNNIEWIGLAARWAELGTRGVKSKENQNESYN